MKTFVVNILARFGFVFSRVTAVSQLRKLVHTLRPVRSGGPLKRLGPEGDGGYTIPNDLEGLAGCLSPGVGALSSFEANLADRGIKVFLADKSVAGPAIDHPNFSFFPCFVASYTDASDKLISLEEWSNHTVTSGDLILQMDIEGFEYEVIHSLTDHLLKRFRIIVVEFHHLHQLLNCNHFGYMSRAFAKLLQNHDVVYISPNYVDGAVSLAELEIPKMMEFTFYRRDRVEANQRSRPDNTAPEAFSAALPKKLPACWKRQYPSTANSADGK